MNEIPKTVSAPTPLKPVSVSAVVAGIKQQKDGNELPSAVAAAKPERVDVTELQENVQAAVAQMNEYIQSTQRDLHFSYDSAAGETVVKVLDRNTQEVIRQIPDVIFLKLAHRKDSTGNFHLFSAHA
jgi:flagellar protein FlaG